MRVLALSVGIAVAVALGGCGDDGTTASEQDDLLGKPEVLGPDPGGVPRACRSCWPTVSAARRTFLFFYRVADALRADGHLVYEGNVPPFQSADVRAEALAGTIELALEQTMAAKVNIVAHSMGGLDARAVVSTLGH